MKNAFLPEKFVYCFAIVKTKQYSGFSVTYYLKCFIISTCDFNSPKTLWPLFTRVIMHLITLMKRTDQVHKHTYTHTHTHTHTHLRHHPKPTVRCQSINSTAIEKQFVLLKKCFLCVYPTFLFKKNRVSCEKMRSNEISLKNESFCTLHMQELNQDRWKRVRCTII